MDQNPTRESRPPINLRIKFRSESLDQFIERYAVDVSRGGIFIRTREPLAVGTQLKLDFQFQNGTALMSGDGTVVWIREMDPNRTSVPPGMGVRFDKLTPESQTVLEQLLVEKAKRERSGIPGSGNQGGGGMAVRRPSSMFSVLEPQSPGAESAGGARPTAPVAASPASPSSPTSHAAPPNAADQGKKDAPGYRPLGTARNPFSSVPASSVPASSVGGLSSITGGGAGQPRATATGSPVAKPASPAAPRQLTPSDGGAQFDDINDEPTQIAGRLPSFLTSDEGDDEEPTVAAKSLSESVAAALRPPVGGKAGAAIGDSAKKTAPSSPGKASVPELQRPAPGETDVRPKQSLDQAPPLSSGETSPSSPRDTAKDVDQKTAGGTAASDLARATAPTPIAVPRPSGVSPTVPGSTGAPATAGSSKEADQPAAAVQVQPTAPNPPAATRSVPAAAVAASVLALGAATFFVIRFFVSESEQVIPPPNPSTAVAIRPPSESIAVGAPSAPAPAAGEAPPSAAPADTPPLAPAPTEGVNAAPAGGGKTSAAETKPGEAKAPDPKTADATAVSPTAKPAKHKAGRSSSKEGKEGKEGREGVSAVEPGATPVKPADTAVTPPPAAAGAPANAMAKGDAPASSPATPETGAAAHEVRVTSKPPGADVVLDGATVGKTPHSIAIADVNAPHSIAVRKEGFEPFEQMISASSAWSKTKAAKGKPALEILKINARLKQIGGSGDTETKAATEPPSIDTESAGKAEVAKPDRPLPPANDDRGSAEPSP
ncbi:MAG: TIGR02266 family protein [Pseudomonadota bacterium]